VDKLKTGEVSTPVLTNERGKQDYRLYYLKARTNPHKANLQDDYARIQQIALERKKQDVIDEWIVNKMNGTFISVSDDYRYCTFQRNWIKN
jgi:peptidyl-prolyl cis-trans isomerase SurA